MFDGLDCCLSNGNTENCHGKYTSKNSYYKLTKISSLEIDNFGLKMMVKSGLEFFTLKFTERAPSDLLLPRENKSAKKG